MAGEDDILRLESGVTRVRSIEDNLHTYSNSASAISAGDVVYQSSSSDTFVELANADDSSAVPPIGVVEEVVDTTSCIVVSLGGIATTLSGLTRGSQYWLDTTAGGITTTRPNINAYLVGVALSSTDLLILTNGQEAFVQSDASGTEVISSQAINNSFVDSSDSDVRNFREIDWIINVTAKGSATRIDVEVEYSDQASPTTYANITSEAITSGTATQSDYQLQFDISAETATFQVGISVPVRGRNMRIRVKTDNASGITASANAYRRI